MTAPVPRAEGEDRGGQQRVDVRPLPEFLTPRDDVFGPRGFPGRAFVAGPRRRDRGGERPTVPGHDPGSDGGEHRAHQPWRGSLAGLDQGPGHVGEQVPQFQVHVLEAERR